MEHKGGDMRMTVKKAVESTHCASMTLDEGSRAVLNSLMTVLKTRDADTYDHSKRTVKISLLLGDECGLDDSQMNALELGARSEEHTSELQSRLHLVCRLLLEKKKRK